MWAGINTPLYFSTISISSYPEMSDFWVLRVILCICFDISFEKPFISFKLGK